MDDQKLKSRSEDLVEMISILSNTQRQLTLSALDYQALGLAKRHEKERAIELANQVGRVLENLIKSLREEIALPESICPKRRSE